MINLILIIFWLLTTPVLVGVDQDFTKLDREIKACPYSIKEYTVNIFDCSNMSHMLGDYLSRRGHSVKYVTGFDIEKGTGHMWLLVDGQIEVESTAKVRISSGSKEYKPFTHRYTYYKFPDHFYPKEGRYPVKRFYKPGIR